ncbi:hypothetical protein PSTG_06834 [Puccinia striiformis f. sp. tritici PST-78]|uniref:Uncharacterized protein n=1 Tax=Puccinia striiformis f. sp. tritici PST-78 TaxID=1165861 RepID=A0A0L0VLA8_9BASI|nr:hypothetical protein PSTG_06834 [Puccinia striiformis f. sp. tritici PST-78]
MFLRLLLTGSAEGSQRGPSPQARVARLFKPGEEPCGMTLGSTCRLVAPHAGSVPLPGNLTPDGHQGESLEISNILVIQEPGKELSENSPKNGSYGHLIPQFRGRAIVANMNHNFILSIQDFTLNQKELKIPTEMNLHVLNGWGLATLKGYNSAVQKFLLEICVVTLTKYSSGLKAWHNYHGEAYPNGVDKKVKLMVKSSAKEDTKRPKRSKSAIKLHHLLTIADSFSDGSEEELEILDLALVAFWDLKGQAVSNHHFVEHKTAKPGELQFICRAALGNVLCPVVQTQQ